MRNTLAFRVRPRIELLEEREVPAFLAPITSAGGGDSIDVGDLNLDGRDDVAVLRGKDVVVSLGTGEGTFRPLTTLTGGKGQLTVVSLGDVNADGKPDVTALGATPDGWGPWGGWPGAPWVRTYTIYRNTWMGKGNGTFTKVTTSTIARNSNDFGSALYNPTNAIGDFNRDGITDLARVDSSNNSVDVLLGNADGTYQPPRTYAAGPGPGSIAVGDFNGDGWADIVVVNSVDNSPLTFSVLLNDCVW
jgi:hypothetical protein